MQVLLLMKDAIKPQSLMMTHNREKHRLLPGGPALQPAAFPTVQQALLYRPPLPTAAQPSRPKPQPGTVVSASTAPVAPGTSASLLQSTKALTLLLQQCVTHEQLYHAAVSLLSFSMLSRQHLLLSSLHQVSG